AFCRARRGQPHGDARGEGVTGWERSPPGGVARRAAAAQREEPRRPDPLGGRGRADGEPAHAEGSPGSAELQFGTARPLSSPSTSPTGCVGPLGPPDASPAPPAEFAFDLANSPSPSRNRLAGSSSSKPEVGGRQPDNLRMSRGRRGAAPATMLASSRGT